MVGLLTVDKDAEIKTIVTVIGSWMTFPIVFPLNLVIVNVQCNLCRG